MIICKLNENDFFKNEIEKLFNYLLIWIYGFSTTIFHKLSSVLY